jgi:hypothetical protein
VQRAARPEVWRNSSQRGYLTRFTPLPRTEIQQQRAGAQARRPRLAPRTCGTRRTTPHCRNRQDHCCASLHSSCRAPGSSQPESRARGVASGTRRRTVRAAAAAQGALECSRPSSRWVEGMVWERLGGDPARRASRQLHEAAVDRVKVCCRRRLAPPARALTCHLAAPLPSLPLHRLHSPVVGGHLNALARNGG